MSSKRVYVDLFTNLADLKRDDKNIVIHVQALRVYHVNAFGRNIESMEVVFHDNEGTRIHCQFKRPYNNRYKAQVLEGGVYVIKNFQIHDNFQSVKTTRHQFQLVISGKSDVKTMSTLDFPEFMYDFRPFDMICVAPLTEDPFLLDVVGKIVGCSKVRTHQTPLKEEKLIEVTMEDNEGKRLLCTLWGKHVDHFNEYIAQDLMEPSIMLLSFCRIKRFNGSVNVSTAFDATKIVLDGDSKEVVDFRASLLDQGSESILTNSCLSFGETNEEEELSLTSIVDLLLETVEGDYWVLGEIDSLEPMRTWAYLGCTECNRKVYPEDARFKCDGCNKTIPHGVYKCKVIFNVVDETGGGHVSFVLFDKECTQLLGVGAYLLRESMMEKNLDLEMVPHELDALVCRKAIFRIRIKQQLGSANPKGPHIFTVGQIITDPKIMSKYAERSEERTTLDDLWDRVENVSQFVEKIGSNDLHGSQSSCNNVIKENLIDVEDPIKRKLFEGSTMGSGQKLKSVKIEK